MSECNRSLPSDIQVLNAENEGFGLGKCIPELPSGSVTERSRSQDVLPPFQTANFISVREPRNIFNATGVSGDSALSRSVGSVFERSQVDESGIKVVENAAYEGYPLHSYK